MISAHFLAEVFFYGPFLTYFMLKTGLEKGLICWCVAGRSAVSFGAFPQHDRWSYAGGDT
jgi:hypothetical protein